MLKFTPINSPYLTSIPWAGITNLRTATTKQSMADERREPVVFWSTVWKHFGFCKNGDVLHRSLAFC